MAYFYNISTNIIKYSTIFWHSIWHVFGSRRAQMQPELAMLATIETHSHAELQEEHTRSKGEVGGRVGGRREGGVVPDRKSRDLQLAGREQTPTSLQSTSLIGTADLQ